MSVRTASGRAILAAFLVLAISPTPSAQLLSLGSSLAKLDPLLQSRAVLLTGQSRVIVRATSSGVLAPVVSLVRQVGGALGRALPIIDGQAAIVPNIALPLLAANPLVLHISMDRLVVGSLERTGATVGAKAVHDELGYDGRGVGIAIIDSGVTPWHDDLDDANESPGHMRVDRFVDFVNGRQTPYDDYGHGTHVAGIVAGNGADSNGARAGIAPGARLTVLKVLDGAGRGRISDVIAAIGYVVLNKDVLDIRAVNLSIATGVYESYNVDPLTVAALVAVRAGVVMVAAGGNNGRSAQGRGQYGGITAPGNAPWVITVGASSHMGTFDRADDTMAAFSSRGPTAVDYAAKPDLVAPGVGIESLSDPQSAFYATRSQALLAGTAQTAYLPYLSLSGTSMAAPVVSGTVALMLQANPALTPNQVKAILQYTSQASPAYDALTQGAGFLNTKGAVELARFLAAPAASAYPEAASWSGHIVWGNRVFEGGRLVSDATAWPTTVTWGATTTLLGQPVVWGLETTSSAFAPWGVASPSRNVVWGTACGGQDCRRTWRASAANDDGDTVVWGTDDGDTVVWGTSDGDTVVWGTTCSDPSCQPVIWERP